MILKDFARDVRRSAAKHLLFLIENKKQILRSAQDDMLGGFFSSLLVRAPILLQELHHTRLLRLLIGHAQVDAFEHLSQDARTAGEFGGPVLEE